MNEFGETEESKIELAEMTTKFSGIIFMKAELEKNFDRTYSRVVEKMIEIEYFSNGKDMIEILGRSGG